MRVLVTGSAGFLGRNLLAHLAFRRDIQILPVKRGFLAVDLDAAAQAADFVMHLAGINRPKENAEFTVGNVELTESLCKALARSGRIVPILFSSSLQANLDCPYGESKLAAERIINNYCATTAAAAYVYRLPNVFGKWCCPNYNSVVATFCYNIARDLPVQVDDATKELSMVYVDDVIQSFVKTMDDRLATPVKCEVQPVYSVNVGELARMIAAFRESRDSLISDKVGTGLARALYATYVSYLPTERFSYRVPKHADPRGVFVEMLKTRDSGQFSYFTAHPGVTRGGHYHHSKTEKFLVIRGSARFRFRDILTNKTFELLTSGEEPQIVDTVPGWSHDITNIGDEELIVMLWANEVFDRTRPDTFYHQV